MKKIPDKSIDLVLTDPPYGINVIGGSKPFGSIGGSKPFGSIRGSKPFGSIRGSNFVKANTYRPIVNDDIKVDLSPLFRVAHNQIIFGGNYFNLPISKGWIVWDKKKKNDWDDNFSDGELAWTSFQRPLKIFRWLYMGCMQEGTKEKRVHPTQKPLELMRWIVKNYSKETDTILDPYMGSGSTGLACKELGRNFIGIEISPEYYKIAENRINNTSEMML
jgi:DNA modification methylase